MPRAKARFIVDQDGCTTDQQSKVPAALPSECPICGRSVEGGVCPDCSTRSKPSYSERTLLFILALSGLTISFVLGFIHLIIQVASAELLGFQFLVYPGIGAGITMGFILYHIRIAQKMHFNSAVFTISAITGLIVFAIGAVAIPHQGTIFYATSRDFGQESLSSGTYLILILTEGILTIGATVKFAKSGSI